MCVAVVWSGTRMKIKLSASERKKAPLRNMICQPQKANRNCKCVLLNCSLERMQTQLFAQKSCRKGERRKPC
jgi:hypothetical protein